jgi:hypothetical protein
VAATIWRFKNGKAYSLTFRGEVQDGVMAYHGKCVDVIQLLKAEVKQTSSKPSEPFQ